MQRLRRRRALAAAIAAILPVPSAFAQPAASVAVVEGFHAALLDAMRNARALGPRGRERRLRPAMQTAFDLPAMTRIAVGPPWTGLAEGERQALVSAFSDWVVATYASRFDGYAGENFATTGESTLQSGDRLVRTQLLRPNDAPVQLNYLLRGGEGRWRVVDVYLNGTISELASRRAEFTALLREGGAERLAAELRRRTGALLGG
ncbi:MAG: Hopanoid biosynthesis protein HpnM [uncultured Acetobacteraceae bacterium]|uniref:Hopanoid biosynthesis protein HpnM n=1 Tax=uncultured Acetobacteraceae bacterium TaxID=169975 RepID=A0A6J4JLS8_9PROT|nr:MAG: Hopanoid biosynthesis protein HpnM [uncultured Acetobacteraceae bacterium]